MRQVNAALLALFATGRYGIHLDVLIERPTSGSTSVLQSMRSFGGVDWLKYPTRITWGIDQPIATGTVTLFREDAVSGLSLSPMMGSSILNNEWGSAIDAEREIEIRVALTYPNWNLTLSSPAAPGNTTLLVEPLAYPLENAVYFQFPNGANGLVNGVYPAGSTAILVTGFTGPNEQVPAGSVAPIAAQEPDAVYNSAATVWGPGMWMPIFQGITTRVEPGEKENRIVVDFADRSRPLARNFLLDAIEVGSDAGTAVETVIQDMLERFHPGQYSLWVPTSPGFAIKKGKVEPQLEWDAYFAFVSQFGWRLEQRWNPTAQEYQLALLDPGRDADTPLYAIGPDNYINIRELTIDPQSIRTVVRGKAIDGATGQQLTYQIPAAADVSTDPLVRRWGLAPMQLAEQAGGQIDEQVELENWVTAVYADVSTPLIPQEPEMFLLPWAELNDFITLLANGVHYDTDQTGAVIGITHTFDGPGKGRTRLRTAEKPKGYYAQTLRLGTTLSGFNAVEQADPTLLNLRNFGEISGTRTSRVVTLGWTRGPAVGSVWVYDTVLPLPISTNPRTVLFSQLPKPLSPDVNTYEVAIPPRGYKRFVLVVPRGTDLTPGVPEYWAQDATDIPPRVEWASQAAGSTSATADVSLRIYDPQERPGVLHVWVNPSSPDSASPTGTADGYAALNSGDTAGPDTVFTTPGGTATLLNELPVHAGRGKRIFAAFINEENVTSGQVPFDLQGGTTVIEPGDGLADGTITSLSQFDVGVRPVEILASLPAGDNTGRVAILSTDSPPKLYRGTASGWTAVVATSDLTGTIAEAQIAAGAVTTTKIADDAVTTPKLVAGSVVTAKIAAGAITANEVAANAIVAGKIATDAVTAATIAAGSITTAKIAALAVTAGEIAADAITSTKVQAGAITAGKIAADAVTTATIAAGSITTEKIAAGAITANEIAANAITSAKILAGAVTADKISVADLSAIDAEFTGTVRIVESAGNAIDFLDVSSASIASLEAETVSGSGTVRLGFADGNHLRVASVSGPTGGVNITASANSVLTNITMSAAGRVIIGGELQHDGTGVGFFSTTPVSKPTVTGSRGGNTALFNLLSALADMGLITNSTT